MSVARRRIIPQALFLEGEAGNYSDIETHATNYFSDAGTTPAVLEDPIYQINDQSGNGLNWVQGTLTARPVLSARYNRIDGTEMIWNGSSGWRNDGTEVTITAGVLDPYGGFGAIKIEPLGGSFRANNFKPSAIAGEVYKKRLMYRSATGGTFRVNNYEVGDSVFLTASSEWQVYETEVTATGINLGFQVNFGGVSTATEVEIYAADGRLASDTDQPAYQRVGDLSADPGDYDSVGFDPYLKADGGDDTMSTDGSLAAGTYKVVVPTREGIWIDEVAHAGGAFTFGPTSYTGGPAGILTALETAGELRLVGPPLIVDASTWTAAKQSALVQWYQNRGAGPELELGPEVFSDPDFNNPAAWSALTGSISGGQLTLNGGQLAREEGVTDLSATYIAAAEIVSKSGGTLYVSPSSGAGYAPGALTVSSNTAGIYRGISTPSGAANNAQVILIGSGQVCVADSVSLRKLQPKGGA